uniref:Uncharacterized protein n=1 Tax=Myripristis murdjan TaxID=586833 RepID=A0A667YWW0_9TELE
AAKCSLGSYFLQSISLNITLSQSHTSEFVIAGNKPAPASHMKIPKIYQTAEGGVFLSKFSGQRRDLDLQDLNILYSTTPAVRDIKF